MKVLELAGPSGVGKSTLASALIVATPFTASARVTLEEALAGAEETDFTDLLEKVFTTAREPVDQRRSFTYRTLYRLMLARRSDKPVLLDGGLMRRAHGIDDLCSDVLIEDYYRLAPLADLTVFLEADEETIVARNVLRGTPERERTVRRSLTLDRIAREILADRGAHVMTLDSRMPVEEMVEAVKARL